MAAYQARRGRPPATQPGNEKLTGPDGVAGISKVSPEESYGVRSEETAIGPRFPRLDKTKAYLRRLPSAIDDLSRELGNDVYERMYNDATVSASCESQIAQSLSRGMRLKPRYSQRGHELFKQSMEAYDLVSRALECYHGGHDEYLCNNLTEVLEDMSRAMKKFGNSASEITWEVYKGKYPKLRGKMHPKSINVLGPESYAYVVDAYKRVPAIAVYSGRAKTGGGGVDYYSQMGTLGSMEMDATTMPTGWEAVPISKFMCMRTGSKTGDPRGVSSLRAAFNPWLLKIQLMPEFLKFLRQFAGPSIVGLTPENAPLGPIDSDTGKRKPAREMLYEALLDFENGSVLAADFGTEINVIQASNDGQAFVSAISMLDHQIVKAISYTVLTEAMNHQTRAASSTGKDISDMPVQMLKNRICAMVQGQLFGRIVYYNMGPEMARLVTPIATLGNLAPEDRNASVQSWAAAGWQVAPSQFEQISNDLEIDPASEEELGAMTEALKNASKPQVNPAQKSGAATQKTRDSRVKVKKGTP